MRVALYARVSTHAQHMLAMQMDAMRDFVTWCSWIVTDVMEENASGVQDNRPKRQELLCHQFPTTGMLRLASP